MNIFIIYRKNQQNSVFFLLFKLHSSYIFSKQPDILVQCTIMQTTEKAILYFFCIILFFDDQLIDCVLFCFQTKQQNTGGQIADV